MTPEEFLARQAPLGQIADVEQSILAVADVTGRGAQFATDPHSLQLNLLDWRQRRSVQGSVAESVGLTGDLQATGLFRVIKAPTASEAGFGKVVMPASYFTDNAGNVDNVHRALNAILPNIQINQTGGSSLESGGLGLPGRLYRQAFIRNAAEQIADPQSIANKGRVVFDVETTGVGPDARIWQLSAQRYDESGSLIGSMNVKIDQPLMDMGLYPDPKTGELLDFDTYLRKTAGGGAAELRTASLGEALEEFLTMVNQSGGDSLLVAQNAGFDVAKITHAIDIERAGLSEQVSKYADEFIEAGSSKRVVDTLVWAQAMLGEDIGLADIKGKSSLFSIENILAKTNLAELIEAETKGFIESVKTEGLHSSKVDVDATARLQQHLVNLVDPNYKGPRLVTGDFVDDDFIAAINRSAAVVPAHTLLDDGTGRKITPVNLLAENTRRLTPTDVITPNASDLIFKGGLFSNWADSVVDPVTGGLRADVALSDSGFAGGPTAAGGVQDRALRMGLPYAGAGAPERLIGTQLSRALPDNVPARVAHALNLSGDMLGVSVMRKATSINMYGRGNLKLPPELVADIAKTLGKEFDLTVGTETQEVVMGRLSAVSSNRNPRAALVVDMFQNAEDIEGLKKHLTGLTDEELTQYGITRKKLDDIVARIDSESIAKGIQIAEVEDPGGKVGRLMKDLGYEKDTPTGHAVRVPIIDPESKGLHGNLAVGQVTLDTAEGVAERMDDIASETVKAKGILTQTVDEVAQNRGMLIAAQVGRNSRQQSGIYQGIRAVKDAITPKRASVGAAAVAGYYLLSNRREQGRYDEAMEVGGYGQGEQSLDRDTVSRVNSIDNRLWASGNRSDPLATAGMVQQLSDNRIRSYQMGPDKYNHLF